MEDEIVLMKLALDKTSRIELEKVEVPNDKQKVINQIASDGNIMLALEMAHKLKDPSIANNIRLRNSWETSNRTAQDVNMLLKKIKDEHYIVEQCIINTTPEKEIYKGDALEFVQVQKELIKTGLEILVNEGYDIPNSKKYVEQILDKEAALLKYEIMLEAFKDQSKSEIVDWETFAEFDDFEVVEYINAA
jgi:hypothetical protein